MILPDSGLDLARRLREALGGEVMILGSSCVVGHCGGPDAQSSVPNPCPTGEPGVSGWTGPLSRIVPALWESADSVVAFMDLATLIRIAGPLAAERRRGPAVVALDEAARFAIAVLDGRQTRAE